MTSVRPLLHRHPRPCAEDTPSSVTFLWQGASGFSDAIE